MSNGNAHVLVGGDFNCGDIEWSTLQVPPGAPKRQMQLQLVDIVKEHCLAQVVNIPTRQEKTLDLLLTNSPSPVNRVKGMPPIGKADILNMTLRLNESNRPRGRFFFINERIWMVYGTIWRE